MSYIFRKIELPIRQALKRGKSILLLGPRQVGKTTLIEKQIKPDISLTFAIPSERLKYEKDLSLLEKVLSQKINDSKETPLIYIDEVQKIPEVMDLVQVLVDKQLAQFILTGSSARKLKRGASINLLPGRVSLLHMDPLSIQELSVNIDDSDLEEYLTFGSLPNILSTQSNQDKEKDLVDYISTYLEEEVRAEALVRRIGSFARFIELSAAESGNIINFSKLSQEVGVAVSTIGDYYQLLEDCLIAYRIDPITESRSKRHLVKSSKYLYFDLGIRRACANESQKLSEKTMGLLFEEFVGLELIRLNHTNQLNQKIKFWRDHQGSEIDYVIDHHKQYIPIEVKWSMKPRNHDARHLKKFLAEYGNAKQAYIVCRATEKYQLDEKITVLPWQDLPKELLANG